MIARRLPGRQRHAVVWLSAALLAAGCSSDGDAERTASAATPVRVAAVEQSSLQSLEELSNIREALTKLRDAAAAMYKVGALQDKTATSGDAGVASAVSPAEASGDAGVTPAAVSAAASACCRRSSAWWCSWRTARNSRIRSLTFSRP